jgi:hypothetical protein
VVAADLAEERTSALGAAFYLEVSAKTGSNIEDLFPRIQKMVLTGEIGKGEPEPPGPVELEKTQKEKKKCC